MSFKFSNSTSLVDDSNPRVQYQPGWLAVPAGVTEVDGTRHGARTTGLTAWLAFTGTGIQVVGTIEPSGLNGRPTTTYSIDGKLVGSFEAPFLADGPARYNVTFYAIHNLTAGDHEILINNTNGTGPNVFWLDYFLVDTSPETLSPPVSTTSSPESLVSTNTLAQSTSLQNTLSPSSQSAVPPSQSMSPGAPAGASRSNIGAIVGGTIAGVVVLAGIAAIWFFTRPRRRSKGTVAPFVLPSREEPPSQDVFASANGGMSPAMTSIPPSRVLAQIGTPSAPTSLTEAASESAPGSVTSYTRLAPSAGLGSSTTPPSIVARSVPRAYPAGKSEDLRWANRNVPRAPEQQQCGDLGSPVTVTSGVRHPPPSTIAPATPIATGVPPGQWYAPPGTHSRAQSLLHAFFSRRARPNPRPDVRTTHDIDSGLRLYGDEVILPPPYTQD
ncbi:hypothetical protein C8Q78DRAFT_109702 [Trametes maxima]|nr:hypothetical protein C8Q78DRAFT_109702 [Trametes maxima]